ncbi:MAG: YdcF family protein [Thermoplasmatales archaeon]|nr:YdcF family protein [Thermoplasmatales archaeon]
MGKILKIFLSLLCIFLVLFFWKGEQFLKINNDDDCLNADAVVVLVGSPEEDIQRVSEGVAPIQEGRGQFLILPLRHKALRWSWLIKSYGIRNDIPENSILIGKAESYKQNRQYSGTFTEAKKTIQIMHQNKLKSAIIVSSGYHMRRAKIAFDRAQNGHSIRFCYHPVNYSRNYKKPWWIDIDYLPKVIVEYIKLIAAIFVYK